MSDPPGTKWLKTSRKKQPMLQLADDPVKGSTQFSMTPRKGGWSIYRSPAESDQWQLQDHVDNLGDALDRLDWYRGLYKPGG